LLVHQSIQIAARNAAANKTINIVRFAHCEKNSLSLFFSRYCKRYVLNGYSMRLSTLLILLFMVVSCSSQHKGAPSTEISFEGKNKLKVKDVLIAYALGVPRPELGTSKNEIEQQLSVSLGTVLKKEQEYIKVRYITLGSQYADEEEYCDFIYYFLYDRLSRGPIVIEKCQNIKIMGLVRKKT
jgi:hypothetical protein